MKSQGSTIPKRAAEDTTLTVSNADGGKTTFPVPAGTEIYFHMPATHYNRMLPPSNSRTSPYRGPTAKYWKDPHMFRPGRFLEDWPRDAFVPFSSGMSGPVMTHDRAINSLQVPGLASGDGMSKLGRF